MREIPPVEDLGDGVWSIPVPIPGNPLGYTLVYLLEAPGGPVLVDAGWHHEESWRALTTGLERAGTSVAEVRGVVVTHFHPDHAGLAGRVREASGAWIAMHHADAAVIRRLRTRHEAQRWEEERARLRRAGASEDEARAATDPALRVDPPAQPDRELSDGDLVDLPKRTLRTVWTPGHSPGHVCLHLEESGRLFTGDHALPRITPHIGLYPFDDPDADPLGSFLDSLDRLRGLDAHQALPAHERRFGGVATRAAEIAAHHEERLDRLLGLLDGEPATLWELAAALGWSRDWALMPPASRRMAAAETSAHLRVLERRGAVVVTRSADGVLGWRARDPVR
ncbi:MBL fold metallo-hydrolase [Marinactinospora thermotolerans]|uniref:MBL fold metallo-hydrolase n=1 Tax=Marinactinospora thermotolerans TaxID=531310 RepID=UPI003D8D2649